MITVSFSESMKVEIVNIGLTLYEDAAGVETVNIEHVYSVRIAELVCTCEVDVI